MCLSPWVRHAVLVVLRVPPQILNPRRFLMMDYTYRPRAFDCVVEFKA